MKKDDYQFSSYLAEQTRLAYGSDWSGEIDDYFVKQALQMQSLTVTDALSNAFTRSITLSEKVQSPRAIYFLKYGAGRRFQMLWHAFRNITFNASVKREKPLNSSESSGITEDLNIIYLNIRGTLDNLCWSLLHEHAPEKPDEMRPASIGFFLKGCLKGDDRFRCLWSLISEKDDWDRDLKNFRDPAVHGIPLAVPPQMVTKDEAAVYSDLMQRHMDATISADFDGAEAIMEQIDNLGRFIPWFVHDPDKEPMPIFPTVPNDLGHLLDLFHAIDDFLSNNDDGVK